MRVRVFACLFAALAIPSSACRKGGGGGEPCPTQLPSSLRIAYDARGLSVAEDGAVSYLVTTPEGAFAYPAETPDGGLRLPWEALSDDPCGTTFVVADASHPSEAVTFAVACAGNENAATSTGGDSGGQGCQR